MNSKRRKIAERRLRSKTKIVGECWRFTGQHSPKGYGRMEIDGHYTNVSRVSAALFLNLDWNNKEQYACHKPECQFKDCWRPEHLYIGNAKTNIHDAMRAGTFKSGFIGWNVEESK